MDCKYCGKTGFEGVVCPQCNTDLVFEAHNEYNKMRCETDAPPTTIGDINFCSDDSSNKLPEKGGWSELEKRMIREKRLEDTIHKQTCLRCGYTWYPKYEKLPKTCPNRKCKSPYWMRVRKNERMTEVTTTSEYNSEASLNMGA